MQGIERLDVKYLSILILFLLFTTQINFTTSPAFLYDEAAFIIPARAVASSPLLEVLDAEGIEFTIMGFSPIFLLLSGLFFKLVGSSLWACRFFSTLCAMFLIPSVYFFVKGKEGRDTAFLSTLILITIPSILAHIRIFSNPSFCLLLASLAIFLFVNGEKRDLRYLTALSGIIFCLAYLNRLTYIASFAFVYLFILVRDGAQKAIRNRHLWTAGISFLSFLLFTLIATSSVSSFVASAYTDHGSSLNKVAYAFVSGNPVGVVLQNLSEFLFGFHSEYGVYYLVPHLFLITLTFIALRHYPPGEKRLLFSTWFFFYFGLYLISSGLFRNYTLMFIPASILVAHYVKSLFTENRFKAYFVLGLLFISTMSLLSFFTFYSNDSAFQLTEYLEGLPLDSKIATGNIFVHALSDYPLISNEELINGDFDYYVTFGTEAQRGEVLNNYLAEQELVFEVRYEPKGFSRYLFGILSFESIRGETDKIYRLEP